MKNNFLEIFKKYLTGLIIFSFVFPLIFILSFQKTEAAAVEISVPVAEKMLRNKETGATGLSSFWGALKSMSSWDSIAWTMANLIIHQLANSTINWINSGFQGNPFFVTNPGDFLKDAADQASGIFFNELGLTNLCAPFRVRIELALRTQMPFRQRMQCTLSRVIENIEAFENDFLAGGWAGWIAMTSQPQNNIYGAYLEAADELARRQEQARNQITMEANWGQGFLSKRGDCLEWQELPRGVQGPRQCLRYDIITPGSAIQDRLGVALGADFGRLEVADELDEILSALIQQLFKKIMGRGGLRGGVIPEKASEMTPTKGFTPLTDCPNAQDENITKIQESVRPEYDYKNYKQGSLGFIDDLIPNLTNLKKCYEDKKADPEITEEEKERIEKRIGEIDSEIGNLEQKRDIDIPGDIADSNEALSVINGYVGQIQNAPSCEAVETIYGDYLEDLINGSLGYQINDSQAVADAEIEYNTLNSRLGQISSEYNQCNPPEEETTVP